MSFSNHGRFRQQVRLLRRQFLQDGELPFTDVLSEGTISHALQALGVVWLDRIYSPLVTLWVFLSQVLSQDQSCRAAVARLLAHRASRGQRPCSAGTGAYCQAIDRSVVNAPLPPPQFVASSLIYRLRRWLISHAAVNSKRLSANSTGLPHRRRNCIWGSTSYRTSKRATLMA
jgi:hypothetical protein